MPKTGSDRLVASHLMKTGKEVKVQQILAHGMSDACLSHVHVPLITGVPGF